MEKLLFIPKSYNPLFQWSIKYFKHWRKVALSVLIFHFTNMTFAQGHYNGGYFNPNDYFTAPPGFIIPVYYSYSNMNFYNSNGQKTDHLINPVPGNPTSLTLTQNVKTNSIIPMLIYGAKSKILNANWGMLVIPTVNNPTANIALDYFSSQTGSGNVKFENNSWGLGDLYVQPIWLTWKKNKMAYNFTYGIWAPLGKYEAGDAGNVGLGYWSHNIRAVTKYNPTPQWLISLAATYEINSKQKDVDFKEAPHFTLDYGFSYTMLKGHEMGLFGFYTTQTGNDKGTQGSFLSDKYLGIGAYGSYWLKPGKYGLLARLTQHFGTTNRFSGTALQIGFNVLFLDLPKTK